MRHVCTTREERRRTDDNILSVSINIADALTVSAGVSGTTAVFFTQDDISIKNEKAKGDDKDIDGDKLCVGSRNRGNIILLIVRYGQHS